MTPSLAVRRATARFWLRRSQLARTQEERDAAWKQAERAIDALPEPDATEWRGIAHAC